MEQDTAAVLNRVLETIDLTLKALDGLRERTLGADPRASEAVRQDIHAAAYAWRQAREAVPRA